MTQGSKLDSINFDIALRTRVKRHSSATKFYQSSCSWLSSGKILKKVDELEKMRKSSVNQGNDWFSNFSTRDINVETKPTKSNLY